MNLLHLNLRYYTIYNNNIQFLKRIKNFLYKSFLENSIFYEPKMEIFYILLKLSLSYNSLKLLKNKE